MIVTMADYWMGRDRTYALNLGTDTRAHAVITVELANKLLAVAVDDGVTLEQHPAGWGVVASGWRPPQLNATTQGAAPNSKHISGQAIDIYDPDGDLDEWCLEQVNVLGGGPLAELGLWMEHPAATKGWSHWQTVPPKSGRRCFYP